MSHGRDNVDVVSINSDSGEDISDSSGSDGGYPCVGEVVCRALAGCDVGVRQTLVLYVP